MELNDMIMISVDDHICEPPDMWEKHLPAKWKDQAPKTDNVWCVEQLSGVIETLEWEQVRRDVQRFLKPHELPSLELWTREFFLQQCAKLTEPG